MPHYGRPMIALSYQVQHPRVKQPGSSADVGTASPMLWWRCVCVWVGRASASGRPKVGLVLRRQSIPSRSGQYRTKIRGLPVRPAKRPRGRPGGRSPCPHRARRTSDSNRKSCASCSTTGRDPRPTRHQSPTFPASRRDHERCASRWGFHGSSVRQS